jgi:rhodanese-related sulfurtransferase
MNWVDGLLAKTGWHNPCITTKVLRICKCRTKIFQNSFVTIGPVLESYRANQPVPGTSGCSMRCADTPQLTDRVQSNDANCSGRARREGKGVFRRLGSAGLAAFTPSGGGLDAAVAQTGASEKTLSKPGDTDFEKIYLDPNSHAGYDPGAKMLAIKVLFRKSDGRLLGAQVLGEDGVPKRIDSFAMAIQMGCTIYDLEEAELCYAPPFGSAKDPVNFAGMVAADILRDDMPLCHWGSLNGEFLLDVRNPPELAVENIPGALNIPLAELRARLKELPRDREILVFCRSGQRAYYATRILLQNGYVANGGKGGTMCICTRRDRFPQHRTNGGGICGGDE